MYSNKVEICGVNTAKLPILTEKEKMDLMQKIKAGDKKARHQMIQGNLRLVLSVVQKFSSRGQSMDDLFQVGCIGLMKAIDNFNPAMGVRFSTYGVPMIIGEIKRFLRDNNSIRVSRTMRDTANKAMQAKESLQKKLGREPRIEEIAEYLEMPKASVSLALESISEPISLYEPVYNDGGDDVYVMDQIASQSNEESWISNIQFRDTIRSLTPRERKIMSLRYMAGKTQTQVAGEIGISQAQVSRLEKSAVNQIISQM